MGSHPETQLEAPLGGLYRGRAFQYQPPYTSELLLNVRPFDIIGGRGRLGSRPPLVKNFATLLGTKVSGTGGTTNAGAGTTFDDAAYGDWTLHGIVPGRDVVEIVSGTNVTAGSYPISSLTSSNIVLGQTPGVSGSSIVYKIGYRPIRMASWVRQTGQFTTGSFTDLFTGTAPQASWAAFSLSAYPASPGFEPAATGLSFAVSGGYALVSGTGAGASKASKLALQSAIDPNEYHIGALCQMNGYECYEIIFGLDNTTPSESNCLSLIIRGRAPSSGCYLEFWQNRTTLLQRSTLSFTTGVWVWLNLDVFNKGGSPNIFGYLNEATNTSLVAANAFVEQSLSSITLVGSRIGLLLHEDSNTSADAKVDTLSFTGPSASLGTMPPEAAMFSADGLLYRELTTGALEVVQTLPFNPTSTTTLDLAADRMIHAAPRLQKLIIADYGVRQQRMVASSSATITNLTATTGRLDDTAVTDWTLLGIDIDGDVVELLAVDSGCKLQPSVYPITALDSANGVTFSHSTGSGAGSLSASSVAYRVLRYMKVYDAPTNVLSRHPVGITSTINTTTGEPDSTPVTTAVAPAGCRSISLWGDIIVYCNNDAYPHGWWMSGRGFPFLFDYGDTGSVGANGSASDIPVFSLGRAAAVNGTQSEFAGLIGEPIVTTIPVTDDLLVMACRTSFYYLRGHPRDLGQLNNISHSVGIVGISAWCITDEGRLFILAPDGLYEITLERAIPISPDIIPQELRALTDDFYDVTMNYDPSRREIKISATGKDLATASVHYIYNLRTNAFFPDSHSQSHDPTATVSYQPGGVGSPVVLWGCRDGYVRRANDSITVEQDDGVAFTTRARYGPVRLGQGAYSFGVLHELVVTTDSNGGSITGEIRVGSCAQEAALADARYSTTLTAGRNRNRYPRLTAGCAYIDLIGTGTRWAVDEMAITREIKGRLRIP